MRVLVCGGRSYMDTETCFAVLDGLHMHSPITCVVHGAASGADMMGERWAYQRRIPSEAHIAKWKEHGRKAGPLRNAEMLRSGVDMVVAFPGGRGTADMIRRAKTAGVPVVEVAA